MAPPDPLEPPVKRIEVQDVPPPAKPAGWLLAALVAACALVLAGCGNAKTIVAINTDPEAAIFREAKFGVVGDFAKVVPALTAAVKTIQETTDEHD